MFTTMFAAMASLSCLLPQNPHQVAMVMSIHLACATFKEMLYRLHFDFISDLWKVFSINIPCTAAV